MSADPREVGVLFTWTEDEDKAQEYSGLISRLWDVEAEVVQASEVPSESPLLQTIEKANWLIMVYPKGRPGYLDAYNDLAILLATLTRLMELPTTKYPLEALSC